MGGCACLYASMHTHACTCVVHVEFCCQWDSVKTEVLRKFYIPAADNSNMNFL